MSRSDFPLRGRQEELSMLTAAIRSAAEGIGRAVLVTGEPGLGKSRLVEEAASIARHRGQRAYVGSVTELERDRPFGAVVDAFGLDLPEAPEGFEAVAGVLGRPAGGKGSESSDLRFLFLRELLDRLESVSSVTPVLLLLEDLHWADQSTFLFVDHLVRRIERLSITLVMTRRPWPRRPPADRLEERVEVRGLRLGPLDRSTLRAIGADVIGESADLETLDRVGDSAGNPLFARLLAEAVARSHVEGADRWSVDDAITRHLDFVSIPTLDLLRTASVFGARFALDDLARVLEVGPVDLLSGMQEAVESGLLRGMGDTLEFRHDLVWHALYHGIPESIRRSMHREIAHVLASEGVVLDRLLSHLWIGARESSPEDARLLRSAADKVAPKDPATASGLYQRALDICSPGDPIRAELERSLVTSLLWSGQFYRARSRAETILETEEDPGVRGDLRRALGRVLVYQGSVRHSLDEVELGLDDEGVPSVQRARLLADASLRRLVCGDAGGAARAGEESLELAHKTNDPVALTVARCALSRLAAFRGETQAALELARSASPADGSSVHEVIELLQPSLYTGLALLESDSFRESRAVFEHGLALGEELGAVWIIPLFHVGLAMEAFFEGRWDRCSGEAATAVQAAQESNTGVWVPWAHSLMTLVACAQGTDTKVSLAEIEKHERRFGPHQFGREWITWASVRALASENRYPEALALGLGEWETGGAADAPGHRRLYGVDLIRLAMRGGNEAAAKTISSVLSSAAETSGQKGDEGFAAHGEGLVRKDPTRLLEAVELLVSSGRTPASIRACEDAASMLHELGNKTEAISQATTAAEWYESTGALADLARCSALLRSLGVQRGVRASRSRARFGWESVTATEMKVLELVAEGLTNREIGQRMFISSRTVETHVAHLFPKLEASSRTELATRFIADRKGTQ